VASVDSGSPAEAAHLSPRDVVLAVDGHSLRDVLDWQWFTDGLSHELDLRDEHGDARRTLLTRDRFDIAWGVSFRDQLFDGVRTCRNRCAFCFMTQLPKGLRAPLYLRDDDYRLSFMQGNFVTLTNLEDADVDRIASQRLTPLYVSLHAVDPDVRERLVCARDDRALQRFDELLDADIELHVQIVLVPGVNDGAQLESTLTWLAEREGVLSVGIVPLGFTSHQDAFACSFNDPAAAAEVIRQVEPWHEAMRKRDGCGWVYLADEFYLNAEHALPPAEHYDGYPQYENGIGLVRSFLDEARTLRPAIAAALQRIGRSRPPLTLVTGTLFGPTLGIEVSADAVDSPVRVLPVTNRLFGGNVSVAGLIAGRDLAAAVTDDGAQGIYLVPDIILNSDGLTLDDLSFAEVATLCGAELRLVSSDAAGLLAGLETVGAELAPSDKE
jgi:putative radical SAM enzyme (TIGR03279 family)